MTTLSEQVLAHWQVRKTKKQKDAFIGFLREQFPELQVEQGGFGNNKNLVLGDIASAKVIFTAHYDTCARMPVPNFIAPKNIAASLGYSLLLCIPTMLACIICCCLLRLVTDHFWVSYWGSFLIGMGTLMLLLTGGPPNPSTANDNTSGVVTLCELIQTLSPEERSKAAFVFFDNEENGMLGSAFFARKHRKDNLKQKLLINFDCVSDGDHFLLVQSKAARVQWGKELQSAFSPMDGKQIHFEKALTTLNPSDQMNFTTAVGIMTMKYKKGIGLYQNRIHTVRDTVFQKENIEYFVEHSHKLLGMIPAADTITARK